MTCEPSDTHLMMKWLTDFLSTMPFERTWVLETALAGLEGIDEFSRLAYSHDDRIVWDERKQWLGKCYLGCFLCAVVVDLSGYWHRAGWSLFKLVPKLHFTAHWHEYLGIQPWVLQRTHP